MDIAHSIPTAVKSISFSFLSSKDVRCISVKQIVNAQLLDELNRPAIGGLYDPSLGPVNRGDICGTCHLTYFSCPGHFGHIELPTPVFHPLFLNDMYRVLNSLCMFCHKFKIGNVQKAKYIAQLRLLDHGLVDAAMGVDTLLQRLDTTTQDDAEDDDDDEADEKMDIDENPVDAWEDKLNEYVQSQFRRATGSRRDEYHDGIAYQMRKRIFKEFLNKRLKGCGSCGAKAYTFRKEGQTKVIEYDLTAKSKDANVLLGAERPNVLSSQPFVHSVDVVDGMDEVSDDSGDDIALSDDDNGFIDASMKNGKIAYKNDKVDTITDKDGARDYRGNLKGKRGRSERLLAPEEVRAHFRRLFENEPALCSLIFGQHGAFSSKMGTKIRPNADIFFLDVLAVTPTRFRPPAEREGVLMEHPQNDMLSKVLSSSYKIRDLNEDLKTGIMKSTGTERSASLTDRDKILGQLLSSLGQLQVEVNSFMDSTKNPTMLKGGVALPPGVKNLLEKKTGLFRQNMMGKRVNYAARSVISPDVNIESNEIGIPPVFARKLTFPEPVTQHNVHAMRQLVINGSKVYPGASLIQYEDGTQQSLDKLSQEQRVALANQLLKPQEGTRAMATSHNLSTRSVSANKKVFRHLRDGDYLILNRQPTLHKPSMMVHKARVLRGEKTIRMHYANCNSYNADFDGDEMNIHFPQSQVARAEAKLIANTDNQYLVPTSGNPLRGLIQDHVVAGVWMTYKETFFTREEYQQLLYGALKPEDDHTGESRIVIVPPAIWKPRALWTGKQIISTIMKNITPKTAGGLHLRSQSRILNTHWGGYAYEKSVTFRDGDEMTMQLDGDQTVLFFDGDLLVGVLDKSQYGATAYGMVHSVYELYGPDSAGRLLGILSRLFTKFLQHRAFTCRMDDLLLRDSANAIRQEQIEAAQQFGYEAAIANFPALEGVSSKDGEALRSQLKFLLEEVLRDDSKMHDLDITVKKKMADLTQGISSRAIPQGLHRRFPDNHMQTMVMSGAKGSAVNARQISCGLGQTELEGRRVPTMVSGKTLPSFQPLETAAIAGGYITSRFLTGIKPQEFFFHCMAGREGLIDTAVKTSRSGYLQRCIIKHLEGLRIHYDNTVRGSDSAIYQFIYGGDGLDVTKQMHLTQFEFCAQNSTSLVARTNPRGVNGKVDDETAVKYMKKVLKHPDRIDSFSPALSLFAPTRYLGSTSEAFALSLDQYIKNNTGITLKSKKSAPAPSRPGLMSASMFRDLMSIRYMKALAEPGEAVGLLAAQGVGEPSTQMTLNTFHFAGHGAANVTLGIPRLREIVLTASKNPTTPTMTIPISAETSREVIDSFCKKASRLTVSEVVDEVTVSERITRQGTARLKIFHVTLTLFSREHYSREYLVQPEQILDAIGTSLPRLLRKEIAKEMKRLGESLETQGRDIGRGKKARDDAGSGGVVNDDESELPATKGDTDDRDSDLEGDASDDNAGRRQRKDMDAYDTDDEDQNSDSTDGISSSSGQSDSNDSDAESLSSSDRVRQKSKWDQKISIAQDLFEKHARPFANSLKFPKAGEKCSFNVEFNSDVPKVLLVGIVERACLKSIIRQIPRIAKCREFVPEKKGLRSSFMTEGSNLKGIWEFCQGEGVLDEIQSNDIHAMLQAYGVEAARATIIKEMLNVFGVYSIKVDPRHLSVIADYMTFDGGFKPFNRAGIASSSSVLLKASYEMTGAFLTDATLYGDYDELTSPASSIVLGQPPRNGTGLFGIQVPLR